MSYPAAAIRNIAFYPVKSAHRIDLTWAFLTPSGILSGYYADRQFMIVRAQPNRDGVHDFVTQRDLPVRKDYPQRRLTLVKPRFVGDVLRLTWDYRDPVELPYDINKGKDLRAKEHEDTIYTVDQGDRLAEWFSDHLEFPVRLVKAAGHFQRKARQNYMPNNNGLQFQDGYPIHWFSIEDVNELSKRAGEEIPWQTFRPQIVVEGLPDQYVHRVFSGVIDEVPFVDPKPCGRCPVTLIDQETGIQRGKVSKYGKLGTEPLLTLQQYKLWLNKRGEKKVIFGENMNPQGTGIITVGTELRVSKERDPPIEYGSIVEMTKKSREPKSQDVK